MHAVCCKILLKNTEAAMLYGKLEDKIMNKARKTLVLDTFGIINLLILKDRR